jgi:hypothetical protein
VADGTVTGCSSAPGTASAEAVCLRVDATCEERALDVRVAVVLDVVVRPAGKMPRDQRPPARTTTK